MLHHTVHIANATKISDSYVGLNTFSLVRWLVVPAVWLFNALHKWLELVQEEALHRLRRLLDEYDKELISSFSATLVGNSLLLLVFVRTLLLHELDFLVS